MILMVIFTIKVHQGRLKTYPPVVPVPAFFYIALYVVTTASNRTELCVLKGNTVLIPRIKRRKRKKRNVACTN